MSSIAESLGGEPRRTGLHEVWLELSSGTRAMVGVDLPDAAAASALANRWIHLTVDQPDGWHQTHPGSGVVVRGRAVIAIKAQPQERKSKLRPREGVWI